jgi:hypothetical protein
MRELLVEGVDGDLSAPGDHIGPELAFGIGPDLPVEDDLEGVGAAQVQVVGDQGVEERPGVAGAVNTMVRETSTWAIEHSHQ